MKASCAALFALFALGAAQLVNNNHLEPRFGPSAPPKAAYLMVRAAGRPSASGPIDFLILEPSTQHERRGGGCMGCFGSGQHSGAALPAAPGSGRMSSAPTESAHGPAAHGADSPTHRLIKWFDSAAGASPGRKSDASEGSSRKSDASDGSAHSALSFKGWVVKDKGSGSSHGSGRHKRSVLLLR